MVVDDDPPIRLLVAEALDTEGYHVLAAENGAAALDLLESERPEVVLLDMRMPVMDGWEFARQVKARGLHLIIITMTAAQSAKLWAAQIEADAYLAKPFDIDDLLDVVARCCGVARQRGTPVPIDPSPGRGEADG
jgi:CheY-like chemotaxis protein